MTPETVEMVGGSAAVMVVLNALAVKFLAPRFLREIDRFMHESRAEIKVLSQKIQDTSDESHTEIEALGNRWHERMDRLNVLVGGVSVKTERNELDIANLADLVRESTAAASEIRGTISGLTIAVQALTATLSHRDGGRDGRDRG